ncbi:MAG: HAMP domain-containing sensor histidine kinase [Anaerohalosphaeraceae bacterium]
MLKRFILICIILTAVIAGLIALGLSALQMHQKTLSAERQTQFVSVAEQIRLDIKRTLDDFVQAEQKRPYTDYLPIYVPETTNETAAFVRSPLADTLTNGLAYGYFQIDSSAALTLPFDAQRSKSKTEFVAYNGILESQLLPALGGREFLENQRVQFDLQQGIGDNTFSNYVVNRSNVANAMPSRREQTTQTLDGLTRPAQEPALQQQAKPAAQPPQQAQIEQQQVQTQYPQQTAQMPRQGLDRSGRYRIESLDESAQSVQVVTQQRQAADLNIAQQGKSARSDSNIDSESKKAEKQVTAETSTAKDYAQKSQKGTIPADKSKAAAPTADPGMMGLGMPMEPTNGMKPGGMGGMPGMMGGAPAAAESEPSAPQTPVQIRIEPFVPLLVPYTNGTNGLFSGQIFLLRHIQIEQTHLIQGFRLNQSDLAAKIEDSAKRFLRRGMGFDLSRSERIDAAYTAILDFGFGEIGLHLLELEPTWIQTRVASLRHWFYAIVAVVMLAIILAMLSLYKSLTEQVRLSKKKDDFISAVSHELRTPLTSIRMYAEMLEKDWVPTEQKRRQYYSGMRQETERLSRLIENVLDFSRIQRGSKQYQFVIGDVNDCLTQTIRMMEPYAQKAGFELHTELADIEPFTFDRDAVMQIAINLIDNACKYARPAADNRITLRTRKQDGLVLIEVEDHGPGVPRREQARIFEAFYRCADESTRQTTGTGLGLALVKRFAEAHHGFVQIITAAPTGCIFRVALAPTPR